jgi:ketosteroid isomerase-like protein
MIASSIARAGVALALAALFAGCERRPSPPSEAEESPRPDVFISLEHRLLDAMRAADTAALGDLWAPEYRSTSAVGHTSTRAEALMAYAVGLVRVDSADVSEVDVRTYGRTAIVFGALRWGGMAAGGPFTQVARFQHVWVRQADGRWQLVASQMTAQPAAGRGRP